MLSEDEQELGVALIDIGGGTTDIAIYEHGAVWHTAVLPIGGEHFTNDLAVGMRTPIPEAEKIKKKQPVYAKDRFRTSRKSRLKILFADKSLMALGPRSEMTVESYLYKPKDKLRQGVINIAHGLSMYIVNKSQKNKKSNFRIVSPTGNLAARGTQGYISVGPEKTLVANQAGTVLVRNIDPRQGG